MDIKGQIITHAQLRAGDSLLNDPLNIGEFCFRSLKGLKNLGVIEIALY